MVKLTAREIKYLQSLKLKKYRQKYGHFLVEGEKMVAELLQSAFAFEYLITTTNNLNHKVLDNNSHNIKEISEQDYKKISSLATPPGIAALVKAPSLLQTEIDKISSTTICLESIKDPGNLGTIIRIADWYGIKQVVCSTDCVDCFNAKTISATMGSIFRIQVVYTDLHKFIENASLPSLAFTIDGKPMQEVKLPPQALIVIGSESHGLSATMQHLCTQKVSIKRMGNAESLNASIATAIACERLINV